MKEDDTGGTARTKISVIVSAGAVVVIGTAGAGVIYLINGQTAIHTNKKWHSGGPKSPYTRKLTRNILDDIVLRPDSDLKFFSSLWNKNKKRRQPFAVTVLAPPLWSLAS